VFNLRFMSLDVGEKRIGVAVSDPLGITAQGIRVVERKGQSQDIEALRQLIAEYDITCLVLGLPRNMNGTLGKKAEEIQQFGDKLKHEFSLPVVYQDERLSTRAVEATLLAADVSRGKRRRVVDKLAAVYILQGYLDRNYNRGFPGTD
jgi:putative Holliday junction resolvase